MKILMKQMAAIMLGDAQKDSLYVEAVYGVEKELHPSGCGGRKGTIWKALESKQPLVIHNLAQEPLYSEISKGTKRLEKVHAPLLCIPLIVEGEPIGDMTSNSLLAPEMNSRKIFNSFPSFQPFFPL